MNAIDYFKKLILFFVNFTEFLCKKNHDVSEFCNANNFCSNELNNTIHYLEKIVKKWML